MTCSICSRRASKRLGSLKSFRMLRSSVTVSFTESVGLCSAQSPHCFASACHTVIPSTSGIYIKPDDAWPSDTRVYLDRSDRQNIMGRKDNLVTLLQS